MGKRIVPIVNNEVYHVFNRSIARQPIFFSSRDYQRMTDVIQFYTFLKPPLRFSHYNRLDRERKMIFFDNLNLYYKRQIEMYAYCIMPNHFHFLLKQVENDGIIMFMRNIQNSYAKFFNLKHGRSGSLFQEMFKATYIETEEQLLHVMRYIHLNPHTSHITNSLTELKSYPWSSFQDYVSTSRKFINTEHIRSSFSSTAQLVEFISDQAGYQRELDKIKHLILE